MTSYRILPRADNDMNDIADYIAQDNPNAALAMIARFIESFVRLSDHPRMGVLQTELHHGLRLLPVENYLIFYRSTEDEIEIVRVLHSARDWREILVGGGA
jgi:toxin ParE1/3/4